MSQESPRRRTAVVQVPRELGDRSLDAFLAFVSGAGDEPRNLIIDATGNRGIDPSGLVTLFLVGGRLRERGFPTPRLLLPKDRGVRSHWGRLGVGFGTGAFFRFHGNALPPVGKRDAPVIPLRTVGPETPVSEEPNSGSPSDPFDVIAELLANQTSLPSSRALGIAMAVCEVAGEMKKDADSPVWLSAQAYAGGGLPGGRGVQFALGTHAYRPSSALAQEHAARFGDRWGDLSALEVLSIHGISRFPPARYPPFVELSRRVNRVHGKATVRAGTARISFVPFWDRDEPMAEDLPVLPGTLVSIIIPGQGEVGG